LVAAFMAYGEVKIGGGRVADHGFGEFYVLAALAILAMGVQATTIRQVGGQSIRTTYISGVLTDLGRGLAERAAGQSGTAVGVLHGGPFTRISCASSRRPTRTKRRNQASSADLSRKSAAQELRPGKTNRASSR